MCITMLRIYYSNFCSKYVVCVRVRGLPVYAMYHLRVSLARPRSQPRSIRARATTPATPRARARTVDFLRRRYDIATLPLVSWLWKLCACHTRCYTWRVNRIIVRNTQVCVDDLVRREKWGWKRIKRFLAKGRRRGISSETRKNTILVHFVEDNSRRGITPTPCAVVGYRAYRLAIAFIVLHPNGSKPNEILRRTSTANDC